MANKKILLVDDEPDILEFMEYNLKKEDFVIIKATNGKEAVAKALAEKPDLIILDIMMPEMDGIETCRAIREHPSLKDIVIAFLTARNEDYSQVAGFEVGADDYITKPIKPRVLVSRIHALLRRVRSSEEIVPSKDANQLVVGDLRIDRERYVVWKNNQQLELPRKEFELLSLLASKPGKVFTREEILDRVWGNEVVVGDRTIDVHIRKLREKLGDELIKTVKGIGYKFDF